MSKKNDKPRAEQIKELKAKIAADRKRLQDMQREERDEAINKLLEFMRTDNSLINHFRKYSLLTDDQYKLLGIPVETEKKK